MMHCTAPIVFSHGNSFPGPCYRLLLNGLRDHGHAVEAVDRFGHRPDQSISDGWPELVDELRAVVEHRLLRTQEQQVWLVGHSLGGLLSLMVAAQPGQALKGRIGGVVMIDSPIYGGWRAAVMAMAKSTGLMPRLSLGRISQRRRHHWPSREAARAHLGSKAVFSSWHPEALDDYLQHGLEDTADGVVLRFRKEVETRIYNTIPHDLERLARHLQAGPPVCWVGGLESEEIRQSGRAAIQRLTQGRMALLPGGHLLPFERPLATARLISGMMCGQAAGS